MPNIAENITLLKTQIPPSVKLVAVSKTRSAEEIMEAYSAGHKIFGENRVQELISKKTQLPGDIEWHLIGHLQTNKVKYIVPFVQMIQSVDSFRLLNVINSEASKINRIVNCLLQIHIAAEETKFGFSWQELDEMFNNEKITDLKYINICGVMGMATFTDDTDRIRREFRYLADCFRELRETRFRNISHFREISMGMSGDYKIAVEEGSTIIRIGTIIFGERNQ